MAIVTNEPNTVPDKASAGASPSRSRLGEEEQSPRQPSFSAPRAHRAKSVVKRYYSRNGLKMGRRFAGDGLPPRL